MSKIGVTYSKAIAAKKGMTVAGVVLIAIVVGAAWMVKEATPAGGSAADINWTLALVLSLATGAVKVAMNYIKVTEPDIIPVWLQDWLNRLFIITLCACILGCATKVNTEFKESIVNEEGGYDDYSYTAVSKTGPFGELDTSNQSCIIEWNGSKLVVGQGASGLSNAGQVIALKEFLNAQVLIGLVNLLNTLAPGVGSTTPLPVMPPLTLPSGSDFLDSLLESTP